MGVGKDCKYLIQLQTAWGTKIADSAAFIQLDCDHFEINPDRKTVHQNTAHASRNKTMQDVIVHSKGSMPPFTISGLLKKDELALFLALFFQEVTEGLTTPFDKTFTMHTTSPDFSTNAGFYATVIEYYPTSSTSISVGDCICQELTLTLPHNGEEAKFSANMVARGKPTYDSNPTGTHTRSDNDFFRMLSATADGDVPYFTSFTIDFGSGAQAITLREALELTFTQELLPQGQDGSKIAYPILDNKVLSYKIPLPKSTNFESARTNADSETAITIDLKFGNAVPGTDDGDFHLAGQGKILNLPRNKDGLLNGTIEGEFLETPAGGEPVTIVTADAVDWDF